MNHFTGRPWWNGEWGMGNGEWKHAQFKIRIPHSAFRICRGFTLIELMIVAAVFSGILLALFISFTVGQGSYLSADASIQVQQEARRALDAVGRELREAGWDTQTPKTVPVSNITAAGSQLDFQIALGYDLPGCTDDDICWGAEDLDGTDRPGFSYRYNVVNVVNGSGQLVRDQLDSGGNAVQRRILANNVNLASFSYAAGPPAIVTVNLQTQVQQAAGGMGGPTRTSGALQTRVTLRN